MSASWDSELSSIIEKTNNNLKLLRKIGDKSQVRAPDGSATSSDFAHSSAQSRAYVGDVGPASSRGSARPRAFVRGDDDNSSMGSHGTARPKAFVRRDDDAGSMGSHTSGARPRVYVGDDGTGSVSSHSSARPKAFIRSDDDVGSLSSRGSARPKAFIRRDDDGASFSSRGSARPKAFIRGDDDNCSMSSRSSARPKAYVRGDDDNGSMSSNQDLGRARLSASMGIGTNRPHVGIAGGGGLTAAMLQQHRATAGVGGLDLGASRSRYDPDESRSVSGMSSRLRRPFDSSGRVPHAQSLSASMGPRIRVPDADIPSDVPHHVVDEIKKSLETHFVSRTSAMDRKMADLRTDVTGLTTQTSSLSSQFYELRDTVLMSAKANSPVNVSAALDPKISASVQANAVAIARLEEHSAEILDYKASVDRELTEIGNRVKSLSSATMKIPTLEDNVEALVANRQKQEQGLFKLADRVQLMHRQMGSLVDMKAVENLLSIRLTREFREMEDRLSQNIIRMAEKMEQKVQNIEKQSYSQRQESLAALKNDLSNDIQRLQVSALRKCDLLALQNDQIQSKEEMAQLSSAVDRQERKLQDAKVASATLRDELVDVRSELSKALQSQQRSTTAVMEEKLEQIASTNKEKTSKFDDQLSVLVKKQKKLEEATKTLQESMTQMKVKPNHQPSHGSVNKKEENDKLRQRLARMVADLESLAATKADLERRFATEEQQFQARLNDLRTTLTDTEKQKETQRLELMQKLQEESKLLGVAHGKNSLLESLLAREKAEKEEKNELVRKSKKEMAEIRDQIRNLESEKEKKVQQLTSELQTKQNQIGLLTETLKRVETASVKMLELSKQEAKTVRRVKATKEHELFIAQLKLKEMERVTQALQNGDEMKNQAALTAASTEERDELEKLLLDSQLEKDELKQELEEMTEELKAAKESQKVIMDDTIAKLSSDYDDKISELKQQIADKEQAMRQLHDTLVEKSNLDALEDELTALKKEKNDLLEQIQRAQIEHERVTLKTETNLRLEHAAEFGAMKSKLEERISELDGATSELETTKATIADLEKELENQEVVHQREVATLTHEIKEARSKIDGCTAQILELEEVKTRLEGEVFQLEAKVGNASAEKDKELAAIKDQTQSELDQLRAELAEVSMTLEKNETILMAAKRTDETKRERLVEMAMTQEEMQSRYVFQIESLTAKLKQERENSRAREQDLEDTITNISADIKALKADSSKKLDAIRAELTDQMTGLTTTLQASQHREQQLQSRLKRILEELVEAANASRGDEVAEDTETSDDDAITHHLDALYATHRRTAHELERLQGEYELTVKQAAADNATARELDNQVKEHASQIRDLELVVEQLREELKEQYHKSALIAKGSDEFSNEMASLREEKLQLKRQLEEEERDRAKREVSYQRRTEMKEREVEELRAENKTLAAAVTAVREKIRAVESAKYKDLVELQSKLNDLEERTAALQPSADNFATLEKDFTETRHEIVTLSAEVQSLYQTLMACCGIMEWSELRASLFDEEEKLARVRSESAREIAKVQSVEQQVLMNAEFLNALLAAHGSMEGDDSLLNDSRWMQKYASIAPEIVEKLRNVESRLREAVLNLQGRSASVFTEGSFKTPGSTTSCADFYGAAVQPPVSQKASVAGAAIALALEKANEDYFSESSETGQEEDVDEDTKRDTDQPDVEQESLVDNEEEGASSETMGVDEQDLIGDMSHDESRPCADLEDAEHVVRDEQETSRKEQEWTRVAMLRFDKGVELRAEVAMDAFESQEDERKEEDADRLASSGDGEEEDMDEVERLLLAYSSKQAKTRIDNECDDSDDFAPSIVQAKIAQKSLAVGSGKVGGESADGLELRNCSRQSVDTSSEEASDDVDPLEESSFDNVLMLALEGNSLDSNLSTYDVEQEALQGIQVETDRLDSSTSYAVDDYSMVEGSFDDSAMSEDSSVSSESDEHLADVGIDQDDVAKDRKTEELLEDDGLSSDDDPSNRVTVAVVEQCGNALVSRDDVDDALEDSPSSVVSRPEIAQLDKSKAARNLSASMAREALADRVEGDDLKESWGSMERDALSEQLEESNELDESLSSIVCGALDSSADGDIESEAVDKRSKDAELHQTNEVEVAEEAVSSSEERTLGQADEDNELEQSTGTSASDAANDVVEAPALTLDDDDHDNILQTYEHDTGEQSMDDAALADKHSETSGGEELASSVALEESTEESEEFATRLVDGESLTLVNDDDDNVYDERSDMAIDPLAERSFDQDLQSDSGNELDGSSDGGNLSPQSQRRSEEDEDEWLDDQTRAASNLLDGDYALTDDREASANVAAFPAMSLYMEEDESSEEDEGMDEVERLLLEQSNQSTLLPQQQTGSSTRFTADDNEFDEASVQSQDDDEDFGGDDEASEASVHPREDELGLMPLESGSDENDAVSGVSTKFILLESVQSDKESSGSAHEIGGYDAALTASVMHERDDLTKERREPRDENESDQAPVHLGLHEEDESGEEFGASEDDDFGDISIPLEDDEAVDEQVFSYARDTLCTPHASSYGDSETLKSSAVRATMYPMAPNSSCLHGESGSEAEQDYLNDSFDLDSSFDEKEDKKERHM